MNLPLATPPWLWDVLAFCLGAAVGSFLGVVAERLPEGLSLVSPPSHCRRCGRPIGWYDNIPLVSFFVLAGRCRWCGGRFSPAHLFVELFTALLTWLLWRRFGLHWELLPAALFSWALLAISLVDLKEQIIPDVISLPGIALGLGFSWLPGGPAPPDALLGAAVGGLGLWGVAWLYSRLRGREGLGMGDVKLLAMMGAFLGAKPVVLALFMGSVIGAVIGGLYLLLARAGRHEPIPFGPFLSAGALLALFGADVIASQYGRMIGWLVQR